MKKKSISQSAFFSLRALIAAAVALAGASLGGFFATADQPTRASGSAKWPGTPTAPGGSTGPVVVGTTLIRGPDRAYQPGASFADLDHGFAAGATRYLHDDGLIYNDTRVPFLWSQDGTTTLFEPSHDLNTTRSVYFPHQITPDGSKVAGSVAFLNTRTTAPWIGERDAGLKYLPLLPNYSGTTIAISNDGRLAAGTLFGGGFNPPPSQAAVWLDGV